VTLLQLAERLSALEQRLEKLEARGPDAELVALRDRVKQLEHRFAFWLHEGEPPEDPKPIRIPEWPKILALAGFTKPEDLP
jgi:BMFP domain-containing protein YqiC